MGTAEKRADWREVAQNMDFHKVWDWDQVCEELGVGGRRQDEGHPQLPREAEAGLI